MDFFFSLFYCYLLLFSVLRKKLFSMLFYFKSKFIFALLVLQKFIINLLSHQDPTKVSGWMFLKLKEYNSFLSYLFLAGPSSLPACLYAVAGPTQPIFWITKGQNHYGHGVLEVLWRTEFWSQNAQELWIGDYFHLKWLNFSGRWIHMFLNWITPMDWMSILIGMLCDKKECDCGGIEVRSPPLVWSTLINILD